MPIEVKELTPGFAAEVSGVELNRPLPGDTFAAIQEASDRFAVLIFRGQPLDDDQQVAFSERFGRLEISMKLDQYHNRFRPEISDISNVSFEGTLLPADHKKVVFNTGNEYWHTDSSFKPVPANYSLLSAREIPPEGGDTEFADARAAYDTWPGNGKGITVDDLRELVCEHSIVYSRSVNTGDIFNENDKADWTPVRQSLIRTHPRSARKSLYTGSHCSHVIGWPTEEGRALIDALRQWTIQPRFIFRHQWRVNDLVIWDNRMVLHRGLPFDKSRYRRIMHRTTVAGDGITAPQANEPTAAQAVSS